ncbi:MAG TPA: YoaK family protein [Candidatus Baltobacteraceae bacterium]|nr:YoaK family protein [Candidatus Baltobacteraceae bacterium]
MSEYRLLPLLFGLTLVSGLIDAVSFLKLGHVFVANMTGNVVLLGFAIGGAKDISIAGSLVAIAAFMCGALVGGRLSRRVGESGAHLLSVTTVVKIVLMLAAALSASLFAIAGPSGYAITAILAISMGLQNAAVRSLKVPDMTTTVVTTTITGIAADSTLAGGTNTRVRRRVASVLIMFAGALIGALLVFRFGVATALTAAALTLAILSAWAWRLRAAPQP